MTLTIELVPHLDAGDRTKWQGDQDLRPLSELGRRQAQSLAEGLSTLPVDALYSSPALRCQETLYPLVERFGLSLHILPGLSEKQPTENQEQFAERGRAVLQEIIDSSPPGRILACSHGDLIPETIDFLVATDRLPAPERLRVRGEWYTIRLSEGAVAVHLNRAPSGFPR